MDHLTKNIATPELQEVLKDIFNVTHVEISRGLYKLRRLNENDKQYLGELRRDILLLRERYYKNY